MALALRTSAPRARLVRIARTRFPRPGRRNVAPVAVAADETNAAVVGILFAAAATVLYRRHRCSVARTISHDNNDYRCTAAETAGYAPRISTPRARLVCIARTRFPKSGRRNVAPVAVTADKTNAAVVDIGASELVVVAHSLPS